MKWNIRGNARKISCILFWATVKCLWRHAGARLGTTHRALAILSPGPCVACSVRSTRIPMLIRGDCLPLKLLLDHGDALRMDLPAIEVIGRVQTEHNLILTMNRPTE